MNKSLDTVVKDVEDLLDSVINKGTGVELNEEILEQFGKNCSNILRRQLSGRDISNKKNIRISSLGKCKRALWYSHNMSEEDKLYLENHNPTLLIRFMFGDLIEELLLALIKLSGHEVTREQEEVTLVSYSGKHSIKGHIDCVIDGKLVDIKSASSYSFKHKFKEGGLIQDDAFGYLTQLSSYSASTDVPPGGFLAMDKQSGELCLYSPPVESSVKPRKLLDEVMYTLSQKEPPERPYKPIPKGKSGNMELPVNCRYCELKFLCYKNELRTFKSSQGPVYLCKVVKEPRMEEIK